MTSLSQQLKRLRESDPAELSRRLFLTACGTPVHLSPLVDVLERGGSFRLYLPPRRKGLRLEALAYPFGHDEPALTSQDSSVSIPRDRYGRALPKKSHDDA